MGKRSFLRPGYWVGGGNGKFSDGSAMVGAAIHGNLSRVPRKRRPEPGKVCKTLWAQITEISSAQGLLRPYRRFI